MVKQERRIPTILGLLIVLVGIGGAAFLVEYFQNVKIQAQPSIVPQEVKITNLNSSGFTVSWVTGEETAGFVIFGEEKLLRKTVLDERDSQKNLGKYLTHHVNIKNLKPNSAYYFKIISQGKSFAQGGVPFKVKTAPAFGSPSSQVEPAYGTVLNKDNSPAQGAIVYLNFKGALPLSTLTKPSGNFLIPLNLAISSDFRGRFIPDQGQKEEIVIRAAIDKVATVVTDTKNDSPIPTIILGKSYDFRSQKRKEKKSLAEKGVSQKVLGIKETAKEVEIIFPKEGVALLDPKPLFKGRGVPRNEVIIKIESPAQAGKTVVNPNGQWFFRPKEPLPPGRHMLIIATKNEKGEAVTLKRTFTVLKSGTQVLGQATPSATLTPTPTPPILTPSPTTLTPTPSIVPGVSTPTVSFLLLGTFLFLIGTGFAFIF